MHERKSTLKQSLKSGPTETLDHIVKFTPIDDVYLHMCVMDSHSTENCKCFYKVLIIFCKMQVIKFVDELEKIQNV